MAIQPPNNGLITENAQQYYQGSQSFRGDAGNTTGQSFVTSFDTDLYLGSTTSWSPTDPSYALNNFKIYTSASGLAGTWTEWVTAFTVTGGKTITLTAAPGANQYIVVQLSILTGGKYGTTEAEKIYGETVEDNYGSYEYTKLHDVIDNFLIAYVGAGKLIPSVKRTDVIFHAKRGLQEFSYDTLKSIKSAELTIPAGLTLVLPQDFVNYVKMSWIDGLGVKHPIYPTNNLISDGNAYDLDARIPKLAEEALYAHIIHAILSVSSGVQEYVVRRFKQERSAKLRNAKIRLSNIKLDQIVQVMRGKSKWLKF